MSQATLSFACKQFLLGIHFEISRIRGLCKSDHTQCTIEIDLVFETPIRNDLFSSQKVFSKILMDQLKALKPEMQHNSRYKGTLTNQCKKGD